MTTGSVARRYAKALLAIGKEANNLSALLKDVEAAAELWASNRELQSTLANPQIGISSRRKIWNDVIQRLGVAPVSRSFLNLLFDKTRLAQIPSIARELSKLCDMAENRLRAEVITAAPVSDEIAARIKAALQHKTGKSVSVTKRVDPGLIGGVVTKVGDLMYDGSLKTRLNRMKETMLGWS